MTKTSLSFFSVATNTAEGFASKREREALSSVAVFLQIISLVSIRSPCPSSVLRLDRRRGVSNEVVIESAFFTTGSALGTERGTQRMTCLEGL